MNYEHEKRVKKMTNVRKCVEIIITNALKIENVFDVDNDKRFHFFDND